jgi:DNA-binding response OmpR family regulator
MYEIMLVEDDVTLAQGIKYSLESEGYNVLIAFDLESAKKLFNKSKLDLILLDVMLPDGSGFDLCKYIRLNSDTFIIFLTACDEEVNVVQGLELGGDDYISKPFRLRELMSRIKVALRRTTNVKKSNIKYSGDLKISILECRVYKNNNEIILTSIEYKLLLMFVNNSKVVLNREKILESIWGIDGEFIDNNTLSVYIKRLREKIEDDNLSIKYIKTIRGLGYMWNLKVRED